MIINYYCRVSNNLLICGITRADVYTIEWPFVHKTRNALNYINCPILCKQCSSFRAPPPFGIPAHFHSFTRQLFFPAPRVSFSLFLSFSPYSPFSSCFLLTLFAWLSLLFLSFAKFFLLLVSHSVVARALQSDAGLSCEKSLRSHDLRRALVYIHIYKLFVSHMRAHRSLRDLRSYSNIYIRACFTERFPGYAILIGSGPGSSSTLRKRTTNLRH